MIISQTPFRISFFGGGTDYPAWYRLHGGAVLATAIDKYCYLSCRHLPPFFEHKHRIAYSKVEMVKDIEQIEHPAVREVLRFMELKEGLEVHHDGDLPARSGMGSSSSFTVGLLNTLYALSGQVVSKEELAAQAIHIEQNLIGEVVGSQDQVTVAMGGLNKITFHKDDRFEVTPVILAPERRDQFESHLALYFTGISRFASEVAKSKVENFLAREKELFLMREFVDEALEILQANHVPLTEFGKLLDEAWKVKRSLSSKVTSPRIDEIYAEGMRAGALGGKLLGAGGGGFVLFVIPPELKPKLREKLHPLIEVNFRFDHQGSRIVLYNPGLMTQKTSREAWKRASWAASSPNPATFN